MVFMRSHLGRTMRYVLGIVIVVAFTILSIVLFFMRIANVGSL